MVKSVVNKTGLLRGTAPSPGALPLATRSREGEWIAPLSCCRSLVTGLLLLAAWDHVRADAAISPASYERIVLDDKPIAFWRMSESESMVVKSSGQSSAPLDGTVTGKLIRSELGPRPAEFPLFDTGNSGIRFAGDGARIVVRDPGAKSDLDFDKPDSITLEAWVSIDSIARGSYCYLVGKGRTHRPGFATDNHNYALRLKGTGAGAAITFLFRNARNRKGVEKDYHRWTSTAEVPVGDGWHHVAITYTFGKKESVRGYIDGENVAGKWDMGGATDDAPVVDDDELWIGSSMGGNPGSSFKGVMDEVAIYRAALAPDRIAKRFQYVAPAPIVEATRRPGVWVQILEGLPDKASWRFKPPKQTDEFPLPAFGFVELPRKYSNKGVHVDRSDPFLLRASAWVAIPKGEHRLLVRARNGARLFADGKELAEVAFFDTPNNGHGTVVEPDRSLAPHIRPAHRGDRELCIPFIGDGAEHFFVFEMIVGGRAHRPEVGESSVSIARGNEDFRLLGSSPAILLTDAGWQAYASEQRHTIARLNAERRHQAGAAERQYWSKRHESARQTIGKTSVGKAPETSLPVHNDVDRFIGKKLEEAGQTTRPLSDDLAFLRRVTVDLIGTIPAPVFIEEFRKQPADGRRAWAIDRLLQDPGWADNWVGYWQDVLAENPNIVNPTLNNTGPFRWWIHESFLDNKPFDQFVTELILMEGSTYYGGPAGFSLATENDAPMAAKAHIVGQAFLALEMRCARCHDAPFHDFKQRDLFQVAAMLHRGPQTVPKTSTVPDAAGGRKPLIEVTLKPGESVPPDWPFRDLAAEPGDGVIRNAADTRERLAALVTAPSNKRFAQVIVNRLWKRYLGKGLVEPVDDWESFEPTHPELLDYLAREFVIHGYDLKHVVRLIVSSHVYQRMIVVSDEASGGAGFLFAGPLQRRMSAEQTVDSLFAMAGKPFDAGQMSVDIDGARSFKQSLHLGEPTRAWQFASLSNERDRPSLALPYAEPFVTFMEVFGWRGSRQDSVTVRDESPTVLQPASVANGVLTRRVTRLTDDSAFTDLALSDVPVEQLVERVFLRVLTRLPSDEERWIFVDLLREGYDARRTGRPAAVRPFDHRRNLVTWSNHLHPRANEIKLELEREVRTGEPPTERLQTSWRERFEDMLWSLVSSPEYVFLP